MTTIIIISKNISWVFTIVQPQPRYERREWQHRIFTYVPLHVMATIRASVKFMPLNVAHVAEAGLKLVTTAHTLHHSRHQSSVQDVPMFLLLITCKCLFSFMWSIKPFRLRLDPWIHTSYSLLSSKVKSEIIKRKTGGTIKKP